VNKKVYIHIGTHKTGSTSIQQFLYANRDRLKEFEYDYPDVGIGQGAHHRLSAQLVKQHNLSIFQKNDSDRDFEIGKFPRWLKLKNYIEASESPNFIISSEEFEWLTAPEAIPELLGKYDYKIILNLRRQDAYLESLYQTFVKSSQRRMKITIRQWSDRVLSNLQYHNYLRLVERWADVFGKANMMVGVFEDEVDKGLEKGFLERIGIENVEESKLQFLDEKWLMVQRQGMDSRCLEFLRLCNAQPFGKEKHSAILSALMEVSREFKEQGLFSKALFTQKRRWEIMNSVAVSNESLREHYFPHKTKLFPDIEPEADEVKKSLTRVVPLFMRHYESD